LPSCGPRSPLYYFFLLLWLPPRSTLFPYTTLFRSIIETTHEVIDREGRRQIDLDTYGRAYLLQRGKLQEVEWQSIAGVIMPRKKDRKSTRLNSSHVSISYAVFCLKKKNKIVRNVSD